MGCSFPKPLKSWSHESSYVLVVRNVRSKRFHLKFGRNSLIGAEA